MIFIVVAAEKGGARGVGEEKSQANKRAAGNINRLQNSEPFKNSYRYCMFVCDATSRQSFRPSYSS
jgi:hypothetical protein